MPVRCSRFLAGLSPALHLYMGRHRNCGIYRPMFENEDVSVWSAISKFARYSSGHKRPIILLLVCLLDSILSCLGATSGTSMIIIYSANSSCKYLCIDVQATRMDVTIHGDEQRLFTPDLGGLTSSPWERRHVLHIRAFWRRQLNFPSSM